MTKNQFLDAPTMLGVVVHDEPIDPSVPPMVRGVKRHYLELPRGIILKRFVNTGRTVKFIGQYNNSENPCNVNPRRIYTIDVEPMWGAFENRDPATVKSFQVSCREDGKLLFRITTMRGRAIAEYLGVKSLKAWLDYCGSKRRGKASKKIHAKKWKHAHRAELNKSHRANLRARKAAAHTKGE